jgi:hypothetical protein
LWFPYLEDGNLLSVHDEVAVIARDFSLEAAVGGVVLEHVDHVVQGNEGIVDSNDLGSIRPNPLIPILDMVSLASYG